MVLKIYVKNYFLVKHNESAVFSRIESYMQQLPTRPWCDINCKVSLHKRSPHVIVWGVITYIRDPGMSLSGDSPY